MNISSLTTGLAVLATMYLSSCSFSSISASNVNVVGNESEATVKKTVSIGNFNELEASQGIKIIFVQGANSGKANISTTPTAEKYLRVEVKNNKLKAYYANSDLKSNAKIKDPTIIRVSSPVLNEVDLSSAAQVSIEGNLNVKGNFELELSSASSFNAENLSCQNLDAELSSSSSAYIGSLNGNLDAEVSSASSISVGILKGNFDGESSSAASINIDSLKSTAISAEASSAASITLSKISGGNIKASASSGAKVKLSGKANSLNKNSSSGGSVSHSKLTVTR